MQALLGAKEKRRKEIFLTVAVSYEADIFKCFRTDLVKLTIMFSHFEMLVYASLCTIPCKNSVSSCPRLYSNYKEFVEDHIRIALSTEMNNEKVYNWCTKNVVNCLKNITKNKKKPRETRTRWFHVKGRIQCGLCQEVWVNRTGSSSQKNRGCICTVRNSHSPLL